MDTELARTFLAVVSAGSFVGAAARLHVTQSTVSFRIQRLEEQLGAALFDRTSSGIVLTAAGRQFQHHASVLTRTVELARQEIGVTTGFAATLKVGGRMGLWENLLLRWLPRHAALAPDVAVRGIIGFEEDLMTGLIEGRIDLAILYTPQARPGLTVERLFDEHLVLVASRQASADAPTGPGAADYLYVDWGPEFHARHVLAFPAFAGAALTVNMGWLGLEHLMGSGGSGYFPWRLVREHERAGRLHRVPDAPEFLLPAWLCYPTEGAPHRDRALHSIRELARELA